jgi:hypothetical protein
MKRQRMGAAPPVTSRFGDARQLYDTLLDVLPEMPTDVLRLITDHDPSRLPVFLETPTLRIPDTPRTRIFCLPGHVVTISPGPKKLHLRFCCFESGRERWSQPSPVSWNFWDIDCVFANNDFALFTGFGGRGAIVHYSGHFGILGQPFTFARRVCSSDPRLFFWDDWGFGLIRLSLPTGGVSPPERWVGHNQLSSYCWISQDIDELIGVDHLTGNLRREGKTVSRGRDLNFGRGALIALGDGTFVLSSSRGVTFINADLEILFSLVFSHVFAHPDWLARCSDSFLVISSETGVVWVDLDERCVVLEEPREEKMTMVHCVSADVRDAMIIEEKEEARVLAVRPRFIDQHT